MKWFWRWLWRITQPGFGTLDEYGERKVLTMDKNSDFTKPRSDQMPRR